MTRTRRNKHHVRTTRLDVPGLRVEGQRATYAQLPDWLMQLLQARMTMWQSGQFDSCPHNPTFRSNIPVRMVAWNPRLVTCPGCAHLGILPPSDPENFRCDGCGRTDDELHLGEITLDRITTAYGVCSACRAAMN